MRFWFYVSFKCYNHRQSVLIEVLLLSKLSTPEIYFHYHYAQQHLLFVQLLKTIPTLKQELCHKDMAMGISINFLFCLNNNFHHCNFNIVYHKVSYWYCGWPPTIIITIINFWLWSNFLCTLLLFTPDWVDCTSTLKIVYFAW